jgi:hypothetical protein
VSIYGIPACSNLQEMSRTMSISFMANQQFQTLNNQLPGTP